MAISVSCPSCGHHYNVMDEAAGKKFRCKQCEAVVEVPAAGGPVEDPGRPEDVFDPLDSGNPTGAEGPMPRRRPPQGRSGVSTTPAERTLLPAIFMYVACGFSIAYSILSIALNLAGIEMNAFPQPGNAQDEMAQEMVRVLGIVMLFAFIFRDLFLIYAAWHLQSRRSYAVAMTGAVISVIPCLGSPCCLLGVPFGIWALVVLNDDAVKAAFR